MVSTFAPEAGFSLFFPYCSEEGEKVTPERPYIEWDEKQYFIINDPPHLLKSVRNNLMKYQFSFDGKTASGLTSSTFLESSSSYQLEWLRS